MTIPSTQDLFTFEQNILSSASRPLLKAISNKKWLLAFDFDGTLAPIVNNREDAVLSESTWNLIEQLTHCFSVAVISGRSRADVQKRVPPGVHWILGNHGYEGLSEIIDTFQEESARKLIQQWKSKLETEPTLIPSMELEDKTYSLTLHYRPSLTSQNILSKIMESIEILTPKPRVVLGKDVVNLMHPNLPNKGTAVETLLTLNKLEGVLFVGDDWNDEDVFELKNPQIIGVRVGYEKTSRAKYFLQQQRDVNILLNTILTYCEVRPSSADADS